MARASIPVDLHNPGQVFACMGFLEGAETLCGNAMGGFDWSAPGQTRFVVEADGGENPFAAVLEFLASAEIVRLAPPGYHEPAMTPPDREATEPTGADAETEELSGLPLQPIAHAPSANYDDEKILPIRLRKAGTQVDLTHWSDGSTRDDFKLYAGTQSAPTLVKGILRGDREKPKRRERLGALIGRGVSSLWHAEKEDLIKDPFDRCVPVKSSFYFDPRRNWEAIQAGYSPNSQNHLLRSSPVVEILAAWGLEHTRPRRGPGRTVRYGAWGMKLPAMLARPALAGESLPFSIRRFTLVLGISGKNSLVTTSREERNE